MADNLLSSRAFTVTRLPSLRLLDLTLPQHSQIQLAPLREQTHRPDDLAHCLLFAPNLRSPLRALSSPSSAASLGYYSMDNDFGLMPPHQNEPPSHFRCGSSINTNTPFGSVMPRITLPGLHSLLCNASLHDSTSMYPSPTQHRDRLPSCKSNAKCPHSPLPLFSPSSAPANASGSGKRYRCKLGCKVTFSTSSHAARHLQTHTSERAFPCTFTSCKSLFKRSDNMREHRKMHFRNAGGGAHYELREHASVDAAGLS